MLFNFRLLPMDAIARQHPTKSTEQLRWLDLSYGAYWLALDETELFRYSEAFVAASKQERLPEAAADALPYVDYYVWQLYINVLHGLPAVLEPVPPYIARWLGADGLWTRWVQKAEALVAHRLPKMEGRRLLYPALRWWGERHLDAAYLSVGPAIHFWSDDANVHIQWDNRGSFISGIPTWEAVLGESQMPKRVYLDEVQSFDTRFLAEMESRISAGMVAQEHAGRALSIDLPAYQRAYAMELSQAMDAVLRRQPTNWEHVQQAIANINALPSTSSDALPNLG